VHKNPVGKNYQTLLITNVVPYVNQKKKEKKKERRRSRKVRLERGQKRSRNRWKENSKYKIKLYLSS